MWNEPSEAQARDDALTNCARAYGPCKIVSCSDNVRTRDRARALWPPARPSLR